MNIGQLEVIGQRAILSEGISEKNHVEGVIYLRLPLVTEFGPDVPTRSQRWKINRIFADLTPYIEQRPRFFVPDESRRQHEETSSTSVVRAHTYILQCEHVGPGEAIPVGSSGALITSPSDNCS